MVAGSDDPKDIQEYIRLIAEQILAFNEQLAKSKAEADKRAANFDKRLADFVDDFGKQLAKSKAEADKRAANFDKQLAKSKAEADKRAADFDKQLAKSKAEADKRAAEADKRAAEADEERKDLRQQMGRTDNRFGQLTEAMTLGDVLEILNGHSDIHVNNLRHNDKGTHNGKEYEIDAFAFSDDCVVVMEAKTTLRAGHVGKFIGQDSIKFRKFFDIHKEHSGKKLYGALAYLKADDKAKDLAHKKGLLIIRSSHANKTLVNPKVKLRDYRPK